MGEGGPSSDDWRKSLVVLCQSVYSVHYAFGRLRQANRSYDTFQLFVAARVAMGVALGGTWPAMHAITGAEPSSGHIVNNLQKSRVILRPYCESTARNVLINIYANEIFNKEK
jgi:hypothetical protein